MWNIVFVGIDKLDINYESPESLGELETFKDNIFKLIKDENTLLVFTADDKLENVRFNAALIVNYFSVAALNKDNIVIGNLLTEDTIADLCVRNDSNTCYTNSYDPISVKKFDTIRAIGQENISKIVHLTDGVEFFLLQDISKLNNIVTAVNYDAPNDIAINYDNVNGRNITYLVSKEQSLKGFNDCFTNYFKYQKNALKRSKKRPENN